MLQELFRKDGGLIMFYRSVRIKLSKIIWLDCKPYAMDQYKINAKDKDQTGDQTKTHSIIISTQKSFIQSAQFIKSLVRYN